MLKRCVKPGELALQSASELRSVVGPKNKFRGVTRSRAGLVFPR
jgi:hypothetical protein